MHLSDTWFLEQYVDFELQQYRLQAYLQEVDQRFRETKLYPQLADLVFHYNNLVSFRDNKRFLEEQFPRKLSGVNLAKLELIYEKMLADNKLMQELEAITAYASARMKASIDQGAEIYDYVERQLTIEPVGILPLYKREGYLLIRYGDVREVRAYAYTLTLLEQPEKSKGLSLRYFNTYTKHAAITYQQIKRSIVRQRPELPQPAVYLMATPLRLPLEETLLPVAQRSFMRLLH